MKFLIENRKAWVAEASPAQVLWLREKLTWEPNTEDEETLLHPTLDGQNHWTHPGLAYHLKSICQFPIEIEDRDEIDYKRVYIPNHILDGITLFDFQVACANKSLTCKRGINLVPTGGGKGEIILAISKYLLHQPGKTTIVVPTVLLADQLTKRAIKRGLGHQIGIVGEGKCQTDKPIVVGVVNSLSIGVKHNKSRIIALRDNTSTLLLDEVQHLRAKSWSGLAEDFGSERLLGFSGSPFHNDDILENSGDALVYGIAQRVIFRTPYSYLRQLGLIALPIVHFEMSPGRMSKSRAPYHRIYDQNITRNAKRNQQILNGIHQFTSRGFKTLVIVNRLEHAELLMKGLANYNAIAVFGGSQSIQQNNWGRLEYGPVSYDWFLQEFETGRWDVAIISSVGDEGMDIPSVGAVILAGGGKSRIQLIQRIGRGSRSKKRGWNVVYILDFWDGSHVYMRGHSKKRLKICVDIECRIAADGYEFWNQVHQHYESMRNENALALQSRL